MLAMLSIRLQRVGRKNEPAFRIVLTDSKNGPKSGKSLEVLGSFDSRRAELAVMKIDRIKHWMSKGAKPSGTIHNLLVERKIIAGKKINVLPKKRPVTEAVKEAVKETTNEQIKDEVSPAGGKETPAENAVQS